MGISRYNIMAANFLPKPIKNEEQYKEVQQIIDSLVARMEWLDNDEKDYLEMMFLLMEDYERKTEPWSNEPLTDAQVIKYLKDDRGYSMKELSTLTGIHVSVLRKAFNGRRELNRDNVRLLCTAFNLNRSLFS